MAGLIVWDRDFVIVSVLIGIALSAAALAEHRRGPRPDPWRARFALHPRHMRPPFHRDGGRRHLSRSPARGAGRGDRQRHADRGGGGDGAIILSISFAMVLFDRKLARNAAEEARRIRAFADAAIEGLVVIDGERVVDANRSFLGSPAIEERRQRCRSALADLLLDVDLRSRRRRLAADRMPADRRRRARAATSKCCCGRCTGAARSVKCSPCATSPSARKRRSGSPTSPFTTR